MVRRKRKKNTSKVGMQEKKIQYNIIQRVAGVKRLLRLKLRR